MIAFQSGIVPVVSDLTVHCARIDSEVSHGHVLEEHSETFQFVHQILWTDVQGTARYGRVHENTE